MTTPQTDFPAIESSYTFDQLTLLFARSGVSGWVPDERAPDADLAGKDLSARPYGRRINDIGQERRRSIEFS
jgi:hypothetical protein